MNSSLTKGNTEVTEPPHHCSLLHHHHHHLHHHHHHHLLYFHPAPHPHPHHHHHHHHHHVLPQCAAQNYIPQNPNSETCPHLTNPHPQIPQPAAPVTSHTNPTLGFEAPHTSHDTQNFQNEGLDEFEEVGDEDEDEDEDPIFVMTDEWREFFAKSEARRREAKKLAKKQGKT